MTRVQGLGAPWGSGHAELLPRGHRVGDWVVTEPIGAGGWATVYAGHRADERAVRAAARRGESAEVALKIMPTAGLAPRQARNVAEAARREVEIGVRAGHPRLIRLLDSTVLDAPDHPALDGAVVLVMERATGSLRDLLDSGVTEAEGGRLIAGICEGLAHLHRVGWVHADLKPENVLIGADGSVRLSDFGLATELTGTHGYAAPMGTLDYLPPERWKARLGERGVQIRPSADIWALGLVIHEVFASGAPLFPGATPVARGAAVQEYAAGRAPLRMAQGIPEFWRALAADCLAPTHAARAAHSAGSLLERITAAGAGSPRRAAGGGYPASAERRGPSSWPWRRAGPPVPPSGRTPRGRRRRNRPGGSACSTPNGRARTGRTGTRGAASAWRSTPCGPTRRETSYRPGSGTPTSSTPTANSCAARPSSTSRTCGPRTGSGSACRARTGEPGPGCRPYGRTTARSSRRARPRHARDGRPFRRLRALHRAVGPGRPVRRRAAGVVPYQRCTARRRARASA